MGTIKEVAKLARVSKTTVSRYLNGKFTHMSEATRGRIAEAVRTLHYRPSLVASSLKTKQTRSVGVIVSNIENAFFAGLVRAIERAARQEGYNVILCNTADDLDVERESIDDLVSRQVEGLLLTTSGVTGEDLTARVGQQFPVVLIDRAIAGCPLDLVSLRYKQATGLAVSHLAELGHTRIGLLAAGPLALSARGDRLNAFKASLERHGLEADDQLIWTGPPTTEGGRDGVSKLMALPNRPTALVSTVNVLTLGALAALHERRVRIPDDVSLVTFDDVPWLNVADPPLTAIAQPVEELGLLATRRLFLRMTDTKQPAPEHISLPCDARGAALDPRR